MYNRLVIKNPTQWLGLNAGTAGWC